MGFSTVGSFILMFFGFMILMTTFIMIYTGVLTGTSIGFSSMRERILDEGQTSIVITGIAFEGGTEPDTIMINLTNSGKTKLDIGYLEVYLDGMKIPRNQANRTIAFMPGSGQINPLRWDPGEDIGINVSYDLAAGLHVAAVSAHNGVADQSQFSA